MDFGATDHVTHRSDWFTSFEYFKTPAKIYLGDKSMMDTVRKGIKIEMYVNEKWLLGKMENVLFVPTARRNLFSVTSVLNKGIKFNSSKDSCEFVKNGVVKARDVHANQLFKMAIHVRQSEKSCIEEVNLSSRNSLHTWHEHLGHQNKACKEVSQEKIDFFDDDQFCVPVLKGSNINIVFNNVNSVLNHLVKLCMLIFVVSWKLHHLEEQDISYVLRVTT